jgi:O-antigen/teichoic acid export membrane protein
MTNVANQPRRAATSPAPAGRQKLSFSANTVLTFVSQVSRNGLTALAWAVIARASGPKVLGEIQVTYLFANAAIIFCNLGLPIAIIYFAGQKRYPLPMIVGNAVTWGIAASSGTIGLLWLGRSVFARLLPISPTLYLTGIGWILPLLLFNYLNSVLLGEKRFGELVWISLIQGSANLIAVSVASFSLGFNAKGLVLVLMLATAFGVVLQLWFLRGDWKYAQLFPSLALIRDSLSLGLKGYFANMAQFMTYRFDSFIVGYISGSGPLGLYAVAYTIAEMLWYVPQIMATVLLPTTASSKSDEANWRTAYVCRLALLIGLLSGAGCFVAAPWLIPAFLGTKFSYSVLLLWLLLPGTMAFVYAKILSADLTGRGHPEYASWGALFSLIATLALDVLLIPRFGVIAAAAISSFVYAAQAAYLIGCFRRTTRVSMGSILIPRRADWIGLKELNLVRLPRVCWQSVALAAKGTAR